MIPRRLPCRRARKGLFAVELLPYGDRVESRACPDDGGSRVRPQDRRTGGGGAPAGLPIVLTSLAFASLHATQWPAPLAIFLLSMALGVLYHRTGSLLAVITMHATFNGFSTLLLLLTALSRRAQAHPTMAKAFILNRKLRTDRAESALAPVFFVDCRWHD